ncbi:MAG TPA: hypothetical protein DDW52_11050 [Planctomycetaceae bacterium]|nr:hypothetical protein [Planctomycetaceae bacterium]
MANPSTEAFTQQTVLLTGATGLVGSQIMARLLSRGHHVIVLVRPTRQECVRSRIERALQPLEHTHLLPRPEILTGDLSLDSLGLTHEQVVDLAQQNIHVIHCAGSIRFRQDASTGEPYATNVDGTRRVLDLAQQIKPQSFHFVSTAYVQNRSQQNVREVLVDSDEHARNDYERSKIQAERLVAQVEHLDRVVIHRPSIVVGDSLTGNTPTFHGFYAPLQVAVQYAQRFGFDAEAGRAFLQHLGLSPSDWKNFVPVDWVAECILDTVLARTAPAENANSSPQILHWTNPTPTPSSQILEVINRVIDAKFQPTAAANQSDNSADFREMLSVYDSYFQCDPLFDRQQASGQCPQLRCPELSTEVLHRLAQWAVENNFGWPTKQVEWPEFPQLENLFGGFPRISSGGHGVVVGSLELRLLGPGAPPPVLFGYSAGRWSQLTQGCGALEPAIRITTSVGSFVHAVANRESVRDFEAQGQWLTEVHSGSNPRQMLNKWFGQLQL